MIINNIQFNCSLEDIIAELQSQLRLNNIPLIQKTADSGNDIMVQCPYHGNGQERRPSAGIRKSDGLFHCFACGETHSLQEVITHCFGHYGDLLGKFGWTWLLKNFAVTSVEERKKIELDFGSRDNRKNSTHSVCDDNSVSDNLVTEEELDKYRYYHPYWEKRGISDDSVIELFDLGYDKDTKCITMPVRNSKGQCVFIARRSVKTKYFNYPKDVSKPLYGLYEYIITCQRLIDEQRSKRSGKSYLLERLNEVFICESMIDALLLWQSGYFAFALNGLGSASQIDELKKLPIRKYILCTDNDKAGSRARSVLRKALSKKKIITEIQFPEDRKDVGECTRDEIDNILQWEVIV